MFNLENFKDGATLSNYDLTRKEYTNGFMVSITNNRVLPENIEAELLSMRKQAWKLGMDVGVWFSDVTKEWFIDLSVKVDRIEDAIRIANKYDQQAVYDLANNECIYLKVA